MSTGHDTGQPVGEELPAGFVRRLLDLSTAHLPERYSEEELRGQPGVVAYDLPYGWMLKVPADVEEDCHEAGEVIAAEVLTVLRFARAHGCDWVLFDADGDVCDQLPTWDW